MYARLYAILLLIWCCQTTPTQKQKEKSVWYVVSHGQALLRRALSIRDDKRPSLIDNALRKRVWPRETMWYGGVRGNLYVIIIHVQCSHYVHTHDSCLM